MISNVARELVQWANTLALHMINLNSTPGILKGSLSTSKSAVWVQSKIPWALLGMAQTLQIFLFSNM